jgi:hypothetical protein
MQKDITNNLKPFRFAKRYTLLQVMAFLALSGLALNWLVGLI